jgi:hypothetical protein
MEARIQTGALPAVGWYGLLVGQILPVVRSECDPLTNLFTKSIQILIRNHLVMIHKPEGTHHIRAAVIIKAGSKNTTDLFYTLICRPELLSWR